MSNTRKIINVLRKSPAMISERKHHERKEEHYVYSKPHLRQLTMTELKKIAKNLDIPGVYKFRTPDKERLINRIVNKMKQRRRPTPRKQFKKYAETPEVRDYYPAKTPSVPRGKYQETPRIDDYYAPEEHFESDIFSEDEDREGFDVNKTIVPGASSESEGEVQAFIAPELLGEQYMASPGMGDMLDIKHMESESEGETSMFEGGELASTLLPASSALILPPENKVNSVVSMIHDQKLKGVDRLSQPTVHQLVDICLELMNDEQAMNLVKYLNDSLLTKLGHGRQYVAEIESKIDELHKGINQVQFRPVNLFDLLSKSRKASNSITQRGLAENTVNKTLPIVFNIQNEVSAINKKLFFARSLQEIKDDIFFQLKEFESRGETGEELRRGGAMAGIMYDLHKDLNTDIIDFIAKL